MIVATPSFNHIDMLVPPSLPQILGRLLHDPDHQKFGRTTIFPGLVVRWSTVWKCQFLAVSSVWKPNAVDYLRDRLTSNSGCEIVLFLRQKIYLFSMSLLRVMCSIQ